MARPPAVGDPAPDFSLPSTQGEISLSKRLADGPVLLVFYPGDDTLVCTRQLCGYRDSLDVFGELGLQVVALNPQSLDSHHAFAKKHALPFPLASDEGGAVCRAYGALGLLGTAKRSLVLVGRDGRVRWSRTDFPLFHQSAQDIRAAISELAL